MEDPAKEIRKLSPSIIKELALILDYADSWKRLMAIIPKQLSSNGYKSDISADNLPKYNSEHFKIIELGGIQYKKSCTEILIDEWGTSGKPRASLGHLKYLLTKAELFRAADYIAKLLGEDPPPRPSTGPAAIVPTNLSEIDRQPDPTTVELERRLDEINYPQVAIEKIRKKSLEVKNAVVSPVIPQIVVNEVKSSKVTFQIPLVAPRAKEVSDMIQFSEDNVSNQDISAVVPELSILLDQDKSEESADADFTPAFSQILSDSSATNSSKTESSSTNNIEFNNESDLIPALSVLNPDLSNSDSSDLLPNFDMLQPSEISYNSNLPLSIPQTSSTKCTSPLPVLSLNTQLPHFNYAELERATMNFSSDKELGAGAFGSVYLATGLLNKPVAVKKLFLENLEIVHENDLVTKQFRNEVEVLYKYKHENLVSLLGYSCDGCTYCLVYEFVPGGSLFDMIEKHSLDLFWKQRLHIALGTARAIAYLHTAFSTPLIHRDIKSANILLDAQKNAKLCDFGIVKLLPNQMTDLETAPCGTSAYMSPEYHRGEISIKLDTFSFGVVLLELLTSLPPLDHSREGADLVTYVEDQCEESIEPLLDTKIGTWQENDVNFAEELYNLTLQCLEDKKKRPVMVEVVKSLENIQGKIIS